ncbi:MAG TPA: uroporphyrinogen-III C-methyltransferase [Acidimicrobiales bacterium]|nr:uroporphyrinogen-III C-methyltransferase [Acidimicrobiales bacterium]
MTVYLVGAGPGDPGLITVRGAEVLGRADVVVYDRLADPRLLELAPPGAERVDVGKRPGGPVDQDSINALLVERGRTGATIVRLKGGDPFVFGRGGEEAAALLAASVPFEVVPGVSAAVAVPAYAGIPVTHRGVSASLTVVTGHSRNDPDPEPDWELLARTGGTLVVMMGVAHRDLVSARLMEGGLARDTPVAAVMWGTRTEQRTVRTTLGELAGADVEPPATLVIGAVAALDLSWYERRPLLGRRVVVTRTAEQAGELSGRLTEAGAEVVEVPTLTIADPSDAGAGLATAARRLARFDWVVLTSANAVERLFSHLHDARDLGSARVAAVGPATAAVLARHGVRADLVARRSSGAALADEIPDPPGSVLLARAEVADPALPEKLAGRGFEVEEVAAYRTAPLPVPARLVERAEAADAVTFASGSAVDAYLAAGARVRPHQRVVCIGPVTAEAARRAGLEVAAVAERAGLDALVDAVVAAVASKP